MPASEYVSPDRKPATWRYRSSHGQATTASLRCTSSLMPKYPSISASPSASHPPGIRAAMMPPTSAPSPEGSISLRSQAPSTLPRCRWLRYDDSPVKAMVASEVPKARRIASVMSMPASR